MLKLTEQGQQIVDDLAQRYGVSRDAVMSMMQAVIHGNGTMAQFNHPEFGGSGQWMQGGMTMVGDMFNYGLKSKVDGLCGELSNLLSSQEPCLFGAAGGQLQTQSQTQSGQQQGGYGAVSLFVPAAGGDGGQWWQTDLGTPASTGSQNNIRYAYFPDRRRLAVEINGHVTVYDTQDHHIGGVSQQQSGDASLTFTSQFGLVRVENLPVVCSDGNQPGPAAGPAQQTPAESGVAPVKSTPSDEIFSKIERLAELHKQGILSEQEFTEKKTELLDQL